MKPKYKVLLLSAAARGHINAVTGFGDLMKAKGHQVIFAQQEEFRSHADSHGFEFIPFNEDIFSGSALSELHGWTEAASHLFEGNFVENIKKITQKDRDHFVKLFHLNPLLDQAVREVITNLQDIDVIISDLFGQLPCLEQQTDLIQIPLVSFSPLSLYSSGSPPMGGFSTTKPDEKAWTEFRKNYQDLWSENTKKTIEWYKSHGLHDYALKLGALKPSSGRHFGFYHYPEDLDYTELGSPDPGWIRVDGCIREPDADIPFELSETFRNKPGKLIYFSMGSVTSIDLKMMKKMISFLANIPHRFIISTGANGDQLTLADNMWGQKYVNQIKVLQTVDLAIIHGGTNTFIETLYYARPLIIIPYFFDQLDNAQRVKDKGIGKRLNLYEITEEKLSNAIKDTLNDAELHRRVKNISENMRKSNSRGKAVQLIENTIENERKRKSN